MIFVTVGAQMPFDRLVKAVDDWAGDRRRDDVFAQIGRTDYRPRHLRWASFLEPSKFREMVDAADAVVAHAGMGSIITALEYGTPMLVLPRRAELLETRNEHQFGTARRFVERGSLEAVFEASDLAARLDRIAELPAPCRTGAHASFALLSALDEFIHGRPRPDRLDDDTRDQRVTTSIGPPVRDAEHGRAA